MFHALDAKNIEAIAAIQLKVLQARLAKMDLALDVSPAALAEIAKVGFDPVFGARPLKRAIQQRIENPLSKLLLDGSFGPKDTIVVTTDPIQAPGQFELPQGRGTKGRGRGLRAMLNFLVRLVLFLLGLVFAASLAVAVLLLAMVWGLRYGWARLTGKPVHALGDALRPARRLRPLPRGREAAGAEGGRRGRMRGRVASRSSSRLASARHAERRDRRDAEDAFESLIRVARGAGRCPVVQALSHLRKSPVDPRPEQILLGRYGRPTSALTANASFGRYIP